MADIVDLWEKPEAQEVYMIAGWRQWADGGSMSSGLPRYLIQQTEARPIGTIRAEGFYMFQIPGTHDLVRPVVKFDEGYPESLEERRNELFYNGDEKRGVVFFLGDEPHLDIEGYSTAFLDAAQALKVKRIIVLGGVYGELPYDKERLVSGSYSLPNLKEEMRDYAVNLSDYHGGASIGAYICRRAGERGMELVGFYAFVPTYSVSKVTQIGNTIHVENDFVAWHGVMRRINHMLKIGFDLSDLEQKREQLIRVIAAKVEELDEAEPQLKVHEYMARLSEGFTEMPFNPLGDVWAQEIDRLFNDSDSEED
jgi:proteasome assembly chaperone (PAC2) family protein